MEASISSILRRRNAHPESMTKPATQRAIKYIVKEKVEDYERFQAAIPRAVRIHGRFLQIPLFLEKAEEVLRFVQPHISVCLNTCLLYTSPSPRDATLSRMPSSA
eukprot:TRINITY_DN3104_c0_g1_i2.p2 TRINITY_DN3104_c0_g1~~TRINITY_DN3104_c0_g1_i2.p2  ORF type:complete len:105 (-),score=18.73 TRINITY_DN3104_c0_g1_i2:9-323(-)